MSKQRLLRVLLAAVAIVFLAGGGVFAWLTRPHYGWLTFGAQERVRMLVCDRGLWISTMLYVDGQQGVSKRIASWDELKGWTLQDPVDRTEYTITSAGNLRVTGPREIMVHVDVRGPVAYSQYCDLSLMAGDPTSARVAQFHGPLTVGAVTANWKVPRNLGLQRGGSPTSLRAFVGTMSAARGCWVVVDTQDKQRNPAFPSGIRPEVEIIFAAQSAGQPPIVQRYSLDQVCCGCVFYAEAPVPADAADGLARVTYSFPSWSAASVASSTIELPILSAPVQAAPNETADVDR
jgi:hypothetical protein